MTITINAEIVNEQKQHRMPELSNEVKCIIQDYRLSQAIRDLTIEAGMIEAAFLIESPDKMSVLKDYADCVKETIKDLEALLDESNSI